MKRTIEKVKSIRSKINGELILRHLANQNCKRCATIIMTWANYEKLVTRTTFSHMGMISHGYPGKNMVFANGQFMIEGGPWPCLFYLQG